MSEWWTYHLSDFLLFSARTYYRLFEIYNAAIWPAQVAAVVLGIWIARLALSPRETRRGGRLAAAILAACWTWVAIAFHSRRYSTINWAAVYFAWAFALEAALLLWFGVVRARLEVERPSRFARRAGLAIFFFALVVLPFVSPLLGRGWKGVEIFGVAPDPTAVATLGILTASGCWRRGSLMFLPAIWCAVSGFTLLAMKSPVSWIPPLVAAIAIVVSAAQARGRRKRERTPSDVSGLPVS
ncbi:MAG: DUF6064 family protein [Acidobacteriota bacterium]